MNDETTGWVIIHRKVCDNKLWLCEPFTKAQAWLDLVINANHKEKYIDIRGNLIQIKRGQLGWSEITMAKRWRWSRNKVRRFLSFLETEQQILQNRVKTKQQTIQQKSRQTSITTILNYETYQNVKQQTKQQTIQQNPKNDTQPNNIKNDKEEIQNTLSNKKSIPKDETKLELKCKLILMVYNRWYHKSLTSIKAIRSNVEYWDELPLERIALGMMKMKEQWSFVPTPTVIFRTRNPRGEQVNHIEDAIARDSTDLTQEYQAMIEWLKSTKEYHEYEQCCADLCQRV